jgi:AraC-like DNA-binding protein
LDPLSDVLSQLKLRTYVSGGFDASGDWAVQFGPHDGIKFHAVVVGECWVAVDDAEPVKVRAGECFLLPRGKPVRLASDMAAEPISLQSLLPPVHDGRIVTYNKGGEFLSIGGYFTLADGQADLLLNVLPPFIHIREEPSQATLRWCVERMRKELSDPQPGDFVVAQQLATMVLVEALRLHLSDRRRDEVGWLFALSDERMRAAISAMHAYPGSPWTLQLMAEEAGMSRTTFATKIQGNSRARAHGISDALENDVGRRQADQFSQLCRRDRPGAWLRVREILRHCVQASHELSTPPIRPGKSDQGGNIALQPLRCPPAWH